MWRPRWGVRRRRCPIAPSATAAATSGNRAGNASPDIARRGPSSAANRTRPGGLPPADPQPLGQQHRRRRTPHLSRNTARLQLGHHRVPDRGPPPGVNLKSTQQFQQLITAERGQVNITQLLPRRGQVTERGIDPI